MLNERLQILVTPLQRKRLDAEARRKGTSVASIVREAIDARLGGVTPDERLKAVQRIRAAHTGRFLPPDDLERIVAEEREARLRPSRR